MHSLKWSFIPLNYTLNIYQIPSDYLKFFQLYFCGFSVYLNTMIKMSMQKEIGKEAFPQLLLQREQAIKCFLYEGKIAVLPEINKKIQERITLWSNNKPPSEWSCVGTGKLLLQEDDALPLIQDFYELPAWNLNRQHGYTICLDDIARIAQDHLVLTLIHSHPSGKLFPSSGDIATFLYTDLLLGRPLIYIIAGPNGSKLILSFGKCWECQDSFFNLIRKMSRENSGGERSHGKYPHQERW